MREKRTFLCLKDFHMEDADEPAPFLAGKTYKGLFMYEIDGVKLFNLVNEQGVDHMLEEDDIKDFFTDADVVESLRALLKVFVKGRNYDTQNPYTRPEVKAALRAYGRATGQNCDYLDVKI